MNQGMLDQYRPGTELTVGLHRARIVRYITSGGFAQVYAVEITPADFYTRSNLACLKRVVVENKQQLNVLRAEVDAMKLLRHVRHVVSYIDSHASRSSRGDGSYEVFLLMEYCERGGLLDYLNTRLQARLTEQEVLNIMLQIGQGIAAMHILTPPLLHRDIKIENVLISQNGDYKLCDFGSVSGVIRPPRNSEELVYVQHDILKNTTAQYRSPEMIDLYRGLSIDEKSDIWAFGVFLYKICYYTTPFEKVGETAILHARYEYPNFPQYSDRLKNLMRFMMMENPAERPNICQVLEEVSRMLNLPCPVRNFYLQRAMEQAKAKSQSAFVVQEPLTKLLPELDKNNTGATSILSPEQMFTMSMKGDIPADLDINNDPKIAAISDSMYKQIHPFQKIGTLEALNTASNKFQVTNEKTHKTAISTGSSPIDSKLRNGNVNGEDEDEDDIYEPSKGTGHRKPISESKLSTLRLTKSAESLSTIDRSPFEVTETTLKAKDRRAKQPLRSPTTIQELPSRASMNEHKVSSDASHNIIFGGARMVGSLGTSIVKFAAGGVTTVASGVSNVGNSYGAGNTYGNTVSSRRRLRELQHDASKNNNLNTVKSLDRPRKSSDTPESSTSRPAIAINSASKESIQRRVQNLMKASNSNDIPKTAKGYGKYVDSNNNISRKPPPPPKPARLKSSTNLRANISGDSEGNSSTELDVDQLAKSFEHRYPNVAS